MKTIEKRDRSSPKAFWKRIYSTIDGKLDKYAVNTFLGLIIALTCQYKKYNSNTGRKNAMHSLNYVKVTSSRYYLQEI